MFRSSTPQLRGPNAYTFTHLVLDAEGNCYSSEQRGLRDLKSKGLVVRYPNPFAGGGEPEVLYQASEALYSIWRTDSGVLHAFGKAHYTNASGTWKKTKGENKNQINYAWGVGEQVWAATAYLGRLFSVAPGGLAPIEYGVSGSSLHGLRGTAAGDVYVSTDDGLVHFDGRAWGSPSTSAPHGGAIEFLDGTMYLTGRTDDDAPNAAVYRRDGDRYTPVCYGDAAERALVAARGALYVEEGWSLARLDGTTLVPVLEATGYVNKALAGNADVLWVANGIELLCFDGREWRSVPRALHETSKG